jgi:hypothetical protein
VPPILDVKLTHVTSINIARNSEFVFMKPGMNFVQQRVTFTYFLIQGFRVKLYDGSGGRILLGTLNKEAQVLLKCWSIFTRLQDVISQKAVNVTVLKSHITFM